MSADPSLDLQKAIVAAVKTANIAYGRIYDRVPPNPTFPYVSFGQSLVLDDEYDCVRGYEVTMQLDVWSRSVGQPECKQITGQIRLLLDETDLTLDSHALVLIEHDGTQFIVDPDGITTHGAIAFRALVERV